MLVQFHQTYKNEKKYYKLYYHRILALPIEHQKFLTDDQIQVD